jgi:hypothetical protein
MDELDEAKIAEELLRGLEKYGLPRTPEHREIGRLIIEHVNSKDFVPCGRWVEVEPKEPEKKP